MTSEAWRRCRSSAIVEQVSRDVLQKRLATARQRLECVRFIAALSPPTETKPPADWTGPWILGKSGDKSTALQTLRGL
ncbi:MAG: hypothetical protein HY735_31355 [Verrucomicrobia bacterium]|nr:hypothetical protein [Verrucomicrobiota bacterium]